MSLKDGWQLVIIDSEDKQQKVREAFEAAGAEDGDAAWIGFENDDGNIFLKINIRVMWVLTVC